MMPYRVNGLPSHCILSLGTCPLINLVSYLRAMKMQPLANILIGSLASFSPSNYTLLIVSKCSGEAFLLSKWGKVA